MKKTVFSILALIVLLSAFVLPVAAQEALQLRMGKVVGFQSGGQLQGTFR